MRLALMGDEELLCAMRQMPVSKITGAVAGLNEDRTAAWKEKTRLAALALDSADALESLGLGLSPQQALDLLGFFPNAVRKLGPIVQGLSHHVFRQLLIEGSENQLAALRQPGMLEPIVHQVTVYINEVLYRLKLLKTGYDELKKQIGAVSPDSTTPQALKTVWQNLCQMSKCTLNITREVNRLLVLAWHTEQMELIEQLTDLKSSCQRLSRFGVGFPETEFDPATGLFEQLATRLFSVYGSEDRPPDFETLPDSATALEGLGKISTWYLSEYWEMGLLPDVKDPADLDQAKSYDKYLKKIAESLKKCGLRTVKDLKQSWIYSKESLQFFLDQRNR